MVANEETMEKIERYPNSPKKPISNIAFYWLLANPYYQRHFNYFPVMLPNRHEYIVDDDSDEDNDCEQSDFVMFFVNLAYLKEDYAKEIGLRKGYHERAKARSMKYRSLNTIKYAPQNLRTGGQN